MSIPSPSVLIVVMLQGTVSSLDLRITAVFVTMVSSVCGMFVPLYLSKWGTRAVVLESDIFRLLRSLSSGIILSVGMCHTVRALVERTHGSPNRLSTP
jgi:hypothetical protein